MRIKNTTLPLALLAAMLLMLGGCADDKKKDSDDDSGCSVANLAGSWEGAIGNGPGTNNDGSPMPLHIFSATVSGTTLSVTSSLGNDTGTIAATSYDNIFEFNMNSGDYGGFMVDSSCNRAGFLDNNFYIGAVQKGAPNLSVAGSLYTSPDIIGSWSGRTVELNSTLDIVELYPSSATVASNYTYTGSDKYGSFSGAFQFVYEGFGFFTGYGSQGGTSFKVFNFLTQDKKFAPGYACTSVTGFTGTCSFTLWGK